MVPSRKWLPWLVCAAIAAAGFPGLAQGDGAPDPPATGDIVAVDNAFRDTSSQDPSDNTVEIAAGGKVTFSYPAGNQVHNVVFQGTQPACTQTAAPPGFPTGAVPPLPSFSQPAGWAGECTFSTPGTYSFLCQAHQQNMTGKVIVEGAATPTPTPTPTATPTATPTPTPTSTAAADVEAHDNWFSNKDVAVKPGESVHFDYPSGSSVHNVKFDGAQPACAQTAGVTFPGAVPPLPASAAPPGWAGDCRFDAPGQYRYFCSAHPDEMRGTVTVGTIAQAPPPPAPAEPVRDGTPAPRAKAWASLSRPASPKLDALLRGTLKLTARCTSVDRGTVTLTVSEAVAKRLRLKGTTLARGSSRCDGNGRFTATLKPTKAATKALRHARKALKVTATLRFSGVTAKQAITLSGAR